MVVKFVNFRASAKEFLNFSEGRHAHAGLFRYLCAVLSRGQIIFAIAFAILFACVLVWTYAKDRKVNRIHFSKAYKVLIAIILFVLLQFAIVKIGGSI